MTNIVIHIGSEKTGSTYIQTLLARNSAQLSAQGLFYPSFLGGINHPWLIPLFSSTYYEDVYVPLGLSGLDSVSFSLLKRLMLRKLASWLRTRKDGVVLFSCEYLFSRLNSCEIHGLYEFLVNFSSEPPTVIAYLRNPVDLALSLYSTGVKCGLSSSFNFSFVSNWNYLNCSLNYQDRFFTWSQSFGFEHVHFYPFHPGLFRTLSFGEHFFERLHIDFSSLYEKVPPQNTSLSLLQLHFLLALNSDYPRFVGHLFNHRRFGLLAFIAGLPSSPSLFMSPQLADKLSSFYSLDFSFCRSLFPSTDYEVWQSIVSTSSCSHSTVDSPLCYWESSLLLLLQENISPYCGFKLSRYLKCKLPPLLRSYSILCSTLST